MDKAPIAAIAVFAGIGWVINSTAYIDIPGSWKNLSGGRTRNSVASLVAGTTAQQLYSSGSIDLEVKKTLFPDSAITGNSSPDAISTEMSLWFTSNEYIARRDGSHFSGKVDKSEFDWKVSQDGPTTYEVGRWGWKLDTQLKLHAADGKIRGSYSKPLAFDWPIEGTYDKDGNVEIDIDVPWSWNNIRLEGKIVPR
jgi:hypothetical protein